VTLKVGDLAPTFRGQSTDGTELSLADYRGKKVVLYFYPMDFTPGCTMQACSLRDHYREIKEKGAEVIGVSTQDVTSHRRFAQANNLGFPLIADPDRAIAKSYGVIGGGGLFAITKALLGVADRVTFIIDEQGIITHIIGIPNSWNHAEEVLALL
jgi:thioredoxin-dependent peroxiredoxin